MRVYGGPVPSGDALPNPLGCPKDVHTLAELAAALNQLRGSRSYKTLIKAEPALRQSTLSDLLNGKSVPGRETVVSFLTACGLGAEVQKPWLAAWERVSTAHLRKPVGGVRVRDARPRRLGVHASIQVDPQVQDLPVYVRRDFDDALHAAINEAAAEGGLVLLTGSSSAGKTRALFEAVRAALPEWWLLHPADAIAVQAFADTPAPRTVVWLDELQRYLSQPGGLPVGTVRGLLDAGLVMVATLWPEEYGKRAAARDPGKPDLYDNDRALLGMGNVIDVPDTFTVAELKRADQLSADGRIRVALDTADAGVTQVLAGGPELIRRWERTDVTDARQCYGKAVITAALDARRVGADAPLTRDFLTAAAPAYLSSAQQATAAPDWFDKAIGYATARLHGATGCLTPVAAGMGQVAGWTTADYLYQHAQKLRHTEPVPDLVWQALVEHHPNDTMWLAVNAGYRYQQRYAEIFCRQAADAGDANAAIMVADLLVEQGRVDEAIAVLRQHADAGDGYAAERLADLLVEQGRVDEAIAVLRQHADAGDGYAAQRLADLLVEQGRVEELRQRADAGDDYAAAQLTSLLAEQGRIDELEQEIAAGTRGAVSRLAALRRASDHG